MPTWLPLSQLESTTFLPGILVESASFFRGIPGSFCGIPESWKPGILESSNPSWFPGNLESRKPGIPETCGCFLEPLQSPQIT